MRNELVNNLVADFLSKAKKLAGEHMLGDQLKDILSKYSDTNSLTLAIVIQRKFLISVSRNILFILYTMFLLRIRWCSI